VVDRVRERVRRRRHEAVDVQFDVRAVLLHRSLPTLPNSRKREQAAVFVAVDREPVPFRRLAAIGLAVARRQHEAAALLERRLPEPARQDLVIADVGDAAGRLARLEEHEAPAHSHKLALAVLSLADHAAVPAGKDCGLRVDRGRTVVADVAETADRFDVAGLRTQIAHLGDVATAPIACKPATG